MRHLCSVLVCVLGLLLLAAPASASAAGDDPVTKILVEEVKVGPYISGGG